METFMETPEARSARVCATMRRGGSHVVHDAGWHAHQSECGAAATATATAATLGFVAAPAARLATVDGGGCSQS